MEIHKVGVIALLLCTPWGSIALAQDYWYRYPHDYGYRDFGRYLRLQQDMTRLREDMRRQQRQIEKQEKKKRGRRDLRKGDGGI